MPRIVHVISARNTIGGAERVVRALVRAGDHIGFPQLVLNPFAAGPDMHRILPEGSPSSYEAGRADHLRELARVRGWLRTRLRDFEPEVIHSHLFHASAMVASLRREGRAVRVMTHHHGDIYQLQGSKWKRWVDRIVPTRFDTVVGVSAAVSDFLRNSYGLPTSQVVTIRNGWEGAPRSDVGKAGAPTIISIGNLRPEKGHETLLRAFVLVRRMVPDARLLIVGEGSERGSLEALRTQLGLGPEVQLLGTTEDIWPLLASSHVFALPSIVEQLGISAMEAMAAGLPVVASDVGGVSEIVSHGVTGLLVPPRNERALSSGLLELLLDPGSAEAMGDRAQESVRDMTMEKMSAEYMALYRRLAKPAP